MTISLRRQRAPRFLAIGVALLLSLAALPVVASPANATEFANPAVPAAPWGVTATTGINATVTVSWSTPFDGGAAITDYVVQYSTDWQTWNTFDDGVSAANSSTITGLTGGVPVHLRVAASNAAGTGRWGYVGQGLLIAGGMGACVAKGTVYCSGSNDAGQLGRPSIYYPGTSGAGQVAETKFVGVKQTSIGPRSVCSLFYAGNIWCLGESTGSPEVWDGNVGSFPLTNVTALSGGFRPCALTNDGRVYCWTSGQLGVIPISFPDSSTSANLPVASVSASQQHTCAVTTSGKVYCWTAYNPVAFYAGISGAIRATTTDTYRDNEYSACAVLVDGSVTCRGSNGYGQRGDGSTEAAANPTKVFGISDAIDIASTPKTNCALLAGGDVKCWGEGFHGQLGNGSPYSSSTPVNVTGLHYAVQLAGFGPNGTFCATTITGDTVCWGDLVGSVVASTPWSISSTLNDPDWVTPVASPPGAPTHMAGSASSGAVSIEFTAGALNGAAIAKYQYSIDDGSTWNDAHAGTTSPLTISNLANGSNYSYKLRAINSAGDGEASASFAIANADQISDVPRETPAFTIASASGTTVSFVWQAAYNSGSPITDYTVQYSTDRVNWTTYSDGVSTETSMTLTNLPGNSTLHIRIAAINANGRGRWAFANQSQISSGYAHTCALNASNVFCWGANMGQAGIATLGARTNTQPLVPVGINPGSFPNGVRQVAVGESHSCAVTSAQKVYCWGRNEFGELGDGTHGYYAASTTPVRALVSSAVQVSAGLGQTCTLINGGSVQCWGAFMGPAALHAPIAIPEITSAVKVTSGRFFSCALLADRAVKCWSLEDGILVVRTIIGVTDAVDIDASDYHACAVLNDGAVRCWGNNDLGELGNGTTTASEASVAVLGISDAISVSAGDHHTCALRANGTVRCWGYNANGAIGFVNDPGVDTYTTATQGPDLIDVTQISSGGDQFTCATIATGDLKCWGYNSNGHLGDGDDITSFVPKDVSMSAANPELPIHVAMNHADSYTTPVSAPSAPTTLNATPGDGSASIAFTSGSDGGSAITKYQYSTDGGTNWADTEARTTSPVKISGLTNGTTYPIKLRAVNEIGAGAASSATSVTPHALPTVSTGNSPVPRQVLVTWAELTPTTGRVLWYRAFIINPADGTKLASCKTSKTSRSCTAAKKAIVPGSIVQISLKAVLGLGGGNHQPLISTPRTITTHS